MNLTRALVLTIGLVGGLAAEETSERDFSALKKDVEDLRAKLREKGVQYNRNVGPIARAAATMDNKYGPDAKVTTREGQLRIGGLLQVWQYWIENDNRNVYSLINKSRLATFFDTRYNSNEINDNDSMRIRRAELKFSLDITKDITAVLMIDPTGGDEANTFPGNPSNQGVVGLSAVSGSGELNLEELEQFVLALNGINGPEPGGVAKERMRNGFMKSNRVVQDAYINYRAPFIPRHDFTIGQFKPPMGEEGNRNSGQLDFIERAMINQFSNQRDLGLMAHGTWFDGRFQYWLGAFDAAGSFQNTFASLQNRSDDNDEKDFAFKILGRPVWNDETWGSLELGYSRQFGVHGESGSGLRINPGPIFLVQGTDGLNLEDSAAFREYAWFWYRPAGPVRGWWLRGEYGRFRDRPLPGIVGVSFPELAPVAFTRQGWYLATGYRLAHSVWADKLRDSDNFLLKLLHDAEFTYRYEKFGNIVVDSLTHFSQSFAAINIPSSTDVYSSNVQTFGINYYWKGYNVRSQLNYMMVDEPGRHFGAIMAPNSVTPFFIGVGDRFREVNNDIIMLSHQVMW